MVQEIIWSAEAKSNLAEIKKHIETDSLFYAERVVRQIYEKATILYKHPEYGMPVLIYEQLNLRRLLYKSYRIIYFIRNEVAHVVAVFHHSRQLPTTYQTDNLFQ